VEAVNREKSRPLRERAYEAIKLGILNGRFKEGNRLVEDQIAEEIGVSRTPVREAIHLLEREGFVRRLSSGRVVVTEFSEKDIEEVFGIRALLESYAARLAVDSCDEALLAEMEAKIVEAEEAIRKREKNRIFHLNTEFHDILYRASGSMRLYQLINNLREIFYRYRLVILQDEGLIEISLRDHREMVSAIRRRDREEVERLVREHIERGKESILRKMRAGDRSARGEV